MSSNKKLSESLVNIQKSRYENTDISSLLKPIGGIKKYVKSGEHVLLKTNLLNASKPEKQVVTNPEIIKAVAIEVQNAGGTPFIGDSPSGPFTKRRLEKVYKKAGLVDLSNEIGIELNYDTSHRNIEIPDGKVLKKAPICNFVSNADKVIALPKIKTHSLMMMTLATKIMYGAVPGLAKVRYHSKFIKRKAFSEMLLDILSVTTPDLSIMDGIVGMQGNGPAGGDPVDLGVILASENPYAIDLAVCKMLEIEPLGIPTLKQAKIRGLWPSNIDYPQLTPEDVKYSGFVLPSTAGYLLTGKKQPSKSPVPTEKCNACGDCKESCPRDAIKINKIAEVDYSKCIKCYCCHEVCMYDAIKLEVV